MAELSTLMFRSTISRLDRAMSSRDAVSEAALPVASRRQRFGVLHACPRAEMLREDGNHGPVKISTSKRLEVLICEALEAEGMIILASETPSMFSSLQADIDLSINDRL